MMSRNFNLGSRDMSRAGEKALKRAAEVGAVSYSTAATHSQGWRSFVSWLCDEDCAIKKMERIEFEHLRVWGESLQERVERCNLSPAKAQNYVSAVNTVMRLATGGQWKSVRPTKDCGISPRSGIATRSRALPKSEYGVDRENGK